MQETRQNRISRLLQKELSLIFQSQTRMMHGVMVSVTKVKIRLSSFCSLSQCVSIREGRGDIAEHYCQREDDSLRFGQECEKSVAHYS